MLLITPIRPEPTNLWQDRRVLIELRALEGELQRARLPLEIPGAAEAREVLASASHQLRDYLIPRFEQWNAPMIIVVGGSTGAGKSSLVNAIVGEEVSTTSAIRPTTRVPLLIHHPNDADWFVSSRILPRWVREASAPKTPEDDPAIRVQSSRRVPAGLAIIDAPDIDSLDELNRLRASELFDAADAWIFATTAMRYADAVPWEYLREARDRNAVIMLVLGRTPEAHGLEISADLERLLTDHGITDAQVFTITEKQHDPIITAAELAPITEWLRALTSAEARDAVVKQTAVGAATHLLERVDLISEAIDAQESAAGELRRHVEENFTTEQIASALQDGELLRGEVLKQWHEFLGTGEYLRRLEAGVGRIRDRLTRLWRRPAEGGLREELGQGFTGLIQSVAAQACSQTYSQWSTQPAGPPLLTSELGLPGPDLPQRTRAQVQQWQAGLLELVRTHGGDKRTTARITALGVNVVGVLLMIVAFASTGGLLGAEVAIAGGTAVVAQRILEAIFGEHGMRQLATTAQEDLLNRAEHLLTTEAERFTNQIPKLSEVTLATAGARLASALERL